MLDEETLVTRFAVVCKPVTAPVAPFTLVTGAVYVTAPVEPLNDVTPAFVIKPESFVRSEVFVGTLIVTAPVEPFTDVTGAVYVTAPVEPLKLVTAEVRNPLSFVRSEVFVGRLAEVIYPESFVKSLVFVGREEASAFPDKAELITLFCTGFSLVELNAESTVTDADALAFVHARIAPSA